MTGEVTSGGKARTSANDADPTAQSVEQLLHELRVHRVELELQNEALRTAHSELVRARERYFDLYNMAPVGYLTLCEEGLIMDANVAACELLGASKSGVIGKAISAFIVSGQQDDYYLFHRALTQTFERQVAEVKVRHTLDRSSSALRWVRLEATSAKDGSGQLGYRVILSDVSDRRVAEETLRASEARHRTLFEQSRDALMTLSPPSWRFTAGNSAALALFGARDQAHFLSVAAGTYWPERQPDGELSAEKFQRLIAAALGEGCLAYEWTYRSLSGREFPASVLLTRLEIDGEPLLQATVRDQTEVKHLHAAVAQQDRLASMGLLAASVAHEINNPLTYVLHGVDGLAERLPKLANTLRRCHTTWSNALGQEAWDSLLGEDASLLTEAALQELVEFSQDALDGARRIHDISGAIGTFSRVESSGRTLVDLNAAIESASTIAFNDIKFKARFRKDLAKLPEVWASEGKLSQIFLNLFINAGHAIQAGNIDKNSISVRTWLEGQEVFAEVVDTGKGIAPADLKRIFEPFFTTKPVGVGSGLGLSICRAIASEFGGELNVESELGKGTRVVLKLPRGADVTAGEPTLARAPPVSKAPAGRILIIDDEPNIRTTLQRLLGEEHQVVSVASVEEAQTLLERDRSFDVILCDLMMPGMTGMDLHEWLVTNRPAVADSLVFMTGGAFTPKAVDYLNRVRNTVLDKPYKPAHVKQLVTQLVERRRG